MNKYAFLIGLAISPVAMAQEQDEQSLFDLVVEGIKEIPDLIEKYKIPIAAYGKYCGPYHGDGTYSQDPIDDVDEACMRHDQCYDPKVGGTRGSCECDFAFVDELGKLLWNGEKKSKTTKAFLVGAIGYFSVSKCECKDRFGTLHVVSKLDPKQMAQCHI